MSHRKKKPLAKQRPKTGLVLIVLALALLVFPWSPARSALLRLVIPLGFPREGSLGIDVSGRCLLAGDEVLVRSPADGILHYLVAPGEWVRAGEPICVIRSRETREILEESLRKRREELEVLDGENEEKLQQARQKLLDAYLEAGKELIEASRAATVADLVSRKEIEDRVMSTCNEIAEIREFLETYEEKRAAILREISYLEQALSWAEVTVLAPKAGAFYQKIDGLEEQCGETGELSAADIRSYLNEALRSRPQGFFEGDQVSRGQILGKIVSRETVKFFLAVRTEERPSLREGQSVTVKTASGDLVGQILRVTDGAPPGYSVISGTLPTGLPSAGEFPRYLDITLVASIATGLIVPSGAIIYKNGTPGLLAVQKLTAEFRPVEIALVKGNEAIIRGISPQTQIVLKGWRFLEGKRVR